MCITHDPQSVLLLEVNNGVRELVIEVSSNRRIKLVKCPRMTGHLSDHPLHFLVKPLGQTGPE